MKSEKLLLILFLTIPLFAFEVEFTKIYKKYVIPKTQAILIKTKANISFPFKFYKVKDGYILIENRDVDNYLNNEFYAPDDAKFINIKIASIDMDKIQYEIIKKIKKTYKSCNIKKLIFLTPDEEKIILKPVTIKEKYKIILECK